MTRDGYYYHAIRNGKDKTIKILDSILKDGIKSALSDDVESNSEYRMNYDDEICLCRDTTPKEKRSVNNLFIRNSALQDFITIGRLILRIDSNIAGVYQPQVLYPEEAYGLVEKGYKGFTEYYDECRTKETIQPTSINGILFPARTLIYTPKIYMFNMGEKTKGISKKDRLLGVICYYEAVQEVLGRNNVSLKIYDSSSREVIESINDITKMKRK